jgi:hypothetical protein
VSDLDVRNKILLNEKWFDVYLTPVVEMIYQLVFNLVDCFLSEFAAL